jgi:hypothetical protein
MRVTNGLKVKAEKCGCESGQKFKYIMGQGHGIIGVIQAAL